VGIEGNVVVVDVEGHGCGTPEAKAERKVREAADKIGRLAGCLEGEWRTEDLLAVDPDGGFVGLVVELPLQQEPAVERYRAKGVVVFAERTAGRGVDVGELEDVVRAGDFLVTIFREARSAGSKKDDVTVGHGGDEHVRAAKVVMAEGGGQIVRHDEGHGSLSRRGRADQQSIPAVRHFILLDLENRIAGDLLRPDRGIEDAGLEVFGEERPGVGDGLLRRGLDRMRGCNDESSKEGCDSSGCVHGGSLRAKPGGWEGCEFLRQWISLRNSELGSAATNPMKWLFAYP
jgi:hypothetical protein